MISVEEAAALIAAQTHPLPAEMRPTVEALGMVLAEDITSDIDSPPHDKSMMDGYAVRAADSGPGRRLQVREQVIAGEVPQLPVEAGQATQIMTGAPIPAGADAVIMVEQTRRDDDQAFVVLEAAAVVGQNILRRASTLAEGETVLKKGHRIRAIETGLLHEVGRTSVMVQRPPRVAVISTGNELVPADQRPAAGQIRNSNGPMLEAQVRQAGGEVVSLGIGTDDAAQLTNLIQRGVSEADVLVLSGGVSAGVMDLVPGVLSRLGVQEVFHKVRLKPGKPLWFGTYRADTDAGSSSAGSSTAGSSTAGSSTAGSTTAGSSTAGSSTAGSSTGSAVAPGTLGPKLVFGLPGNPNSSLVCFELFVRPALGALAHRGDMELPRQAARLTESHQHRGDRPTYFPAWYETDGETDHVRPLAWKGSADQRTLCQANCLLFLPPGDRAYQAGDEVTILLL